MYPSIASSFVLCFFILIDILPISQGGDDEPKEDCGEDDDDAEASVLSGHTRLLHRLACSLHTFYCRLAHSDKDGFIQVVPFVGKSMTASFRVFSFVSFCWFFCASSLIFFLSIPAYSYAFHPLVWLYLAMLSVVFWQRCFHRISLFHVASCTFFQNCYLFLQWWLSF